MDHGMKAKTIKSILRRKINNWLETIEDEELRKACKKETIVTGGCIASMLLGEKINDFDIYFQTKETTKAVAEYYVKKFKEAREKDGDREGIQIPLSVQEMEDVRGKPRIRIVAKSAGVEGEKKEEKYEYFESRPDEEAGNYVSEIYDNPQDVQDVFEEAKEMLPKEEDNKPPYRPIFLSSNAIMLAGKLQIIIRFFGEPDEIHDNYDFTHCTNFWTSNDNQLVLNSKAMQCLLSRTLVYQGSRYPVCSLFRLRKFIGRGWRVNAGQMLKIAMQISELDLTDYKVLEDQLTGVDVAYFAQILERVQDKGDKIESAYLVEIIDRMFGE